MRLKPFKIFEAKAKNEREEILKESFFNIEDLPGIEEIRYVKNNKDYYTIIIDCGELETGFEAAIERHLLKAEVIRLINKNLKKIEDKIEFNFEDDFRDRDDIVVLEIYFEDIVSTDIDINEVIFISDYEYEYDKLKLKRFFKLKYNLDVTSSKAYNSENKYSEPYSLLKIVVSQTIDDDSEIRDKIVEDFLKIKGDAEYGFSDEFIAELAIDGNTISIYPDTSLAYGG